MFYHGYFPFSLFVWTPLYPRLTAAAQSFDVHKYINKQQQQSESSKRTNPELHSAAAALLAVSWRSAADWALIFTHVLRQRVWERSSHDLYALDLRVVLSFAELSNQLA